jgi:spore coat protein U-like protein
MDNGLNASSGQRRVKGVTPTNFVNYNLYTDAARTNSWSGATSVNGTGSATLTVYGQVPVQAGIAIDVYTDTVTVTATY